jgi:regulator of protease activity HflC (stomatin/prohibitin superfamily)
MWAMEEELDVLQDDLNYWAAQVNMIMSEKSKREQADLDKAAAEIAAQQSYDAEQKILEAEAKRLAAEADAEVLRLQQEAEAQEREALRLAQEEEQKKLDRKLRDIDNLPEDERNALLAEVLQQKIDVALNEFSDEFWTQANREIDNFWWMVDRQHELKYEYILEL